MKRSHRHTIMDGRVVTFAKDFRVQAEGAFGPILDAVGPFEISASRNMVCVHKADLSVDDFDEFNRALELARQEYRFLARCDGRPYDSDKGEPREIP